VLVFLCATANTKPEHSLSCAAGSAVDINSTRSGLVHVSLKVGLELIAALPNRDNRRRRGSETQPMARRSRDGGLAVVRPDCDVPQTGALMQCKASSRSAGPVWVSLSGGGKRASNLVRIASRRRSFRSVCRRALICRRQAGRPSHLSEVHKCAICTSSLLAQRSRACARWCCCWCCCALLRVP
jgi:hypothetical protein